MRPLVFMEMTTAMRYLLISGIFCFTATYAFADGVLISWSPRDVPGITEQAFNEAKQWSADQIAQKNLGASSWTDAFLVAVAASQKKDDKQLLTGMMSQLTNTKKTALTNTSRLIVWERITSGELLFEGKGYQIDDDIFSVAGRANWILRTATKKNFGFVRPNTTDAELSALQQKWKRYLNGEAVDEYKNPYESSEKGLEELRSPAAIEAMIVALKPNEAKDRLTKDCLKNIYKTDKLPESGPETMCSPDTMTHKYLQIITGIPDKHDHAWWKAWWDKNSSKLEWKPAVGRFDLKN